MASELPSSSASGPQEASLAAAAASLSLAPEADDDDLDAAPAKRVWTAEELAARASAQAEEEAAHAAEQSALKEEQARLAAQIRARRVGFAAPQSGMDAPSHAAFGMDPSDYTQHDSRRKPTVLLVAGAEGCAFAAPLAQAWLRKLQAHVITASVASSSEEATAAATNPLLERMLQEYGLTASSHAAAASASAAASSCSSSSSPAAVAPAPVAASIPLLSHVLQRAGAAAPTCIVSLDDASRSASDAAASGSASKRVHQPFATPSSWEEAEQVGAQIKEFVQDLPDLLAVL